MELYSEEMSRDPYALYAELRRNGCSDVVHLDDLGVSLVLDYEGVKRGLHDHASFGSELAVALGQTFEWLPFMDPPRHTRLRAIVSRVFTPRSIAALEDRIRALSGALADRLLAAGSGEVDLTVGFAQALPMLVMADMLGLPHEDEPRLHAWNAAIVNLTNAMFAGGADSTKNALETIEAEVAAYLEAQVAERRRRPMDDLLTRLVRAEVDGSGLTQRELLHFFEVLLIAGTETTTNLISNSIICLTRHPAELARLRADPALLPSAIEEVLRYDTPVQASFRVTRRPLELGGRELPAGRLVYLMLGAANRDEKQFADPERFDIGRSPNPHLAFVQGIHACLGAPLGRLEGRIALADLLSRMSTFELVSQTWPTWGAFQIHGPASLPIRYTR
jgi:cytochrome P450